MSKKSMSAASLFGLDSSNCEIIEGYDNIVSAAKAEKLNYLNKPNYTLKTIILAYKWTDPLGNRFRSSRVYNTSRILYLLEDLDLIINSKNMRDLKYHLKIQK